MTSSPVSSLNIFLFSAPNFRLSGIKILLSLLQDSIHEGTSAPLASSIPLSGNDQFILQNQLSRRFPQGDFLLNPVCPDSFSPVCTPGPQPRFLPRTALAMTHSILSWKDLVPVTATDQGLLCTVPTEERLPACAQTGQDPQRSWLL